MNHVAPIKQFSPDGVLYRCQIACPVCKSLESAVRESRGRFEADRVVRRRICTGCGERFTTHEMIAGRQLVLSDAMEKIARVEKSLAWIVRVIGELGEQLKDSKA